MKNNMNKAKLIAAGIVAILTLIVVFQNTAPVQTKVLFATIEMPRAVLLFGTTAVGFLLGILTALHLTRKKKE